MLGGSLTCARVTQSPNANDLGSEVRSGEARAKLIAARIRLTAAGRRDHHEARLPWFALGHAVAGDLEHMHAAHDIRRLPISSRRRVVGPALVRAKRGLQSLLHPLPEAQSTWNGATARVTTFLLRQMVAQAQSIESLEQQVEQLQEELRK
jgi:hypothetical protein